jgi:hypothetical protein
LEPVADAQQQISGRMEFAQTIEQMMLKFGRQDLSRGDIVSVTESAGNGQDLVSFQHPPIFQQPVDVHAFSNGSRLLKRKRGFRIAVGAGRSEHQDSWFGHRGLPNFSFMICPTSRLRTLSPLKRSAEQQLPGEREASIT